MEMKCSRRAYMELPLRSYHFFQALRERSLAVVRLCKRDNPALRGFPSCAVIESALVFLLDFQDLKKRRQLCSGKRLY